jgi:hypothetical protein
LHEGCKRRVDVAIAADIDDDELLPDRLRRGLHFFALGFGHKRVGVHQHGNRRGARHQLSEQLQPLRPDRAREERRPGDIGTRPAEAGDQAVPDRVASGREHDRDRRGLGLRGKRRIVVAHDNGDRPANQADDQRRQPAGIIVPRVELDRRVLPFDVAGFLQALAERAHEVRHVGERPAAHEANHRHRRLLPARCLRPCNGRAAEQCDEFPADHSITSSARANLNTSARRSLRLKTGKPSESAPWT